MTNHPGSEVSAQERLPVTACRLSPTDVSQYLPLNRYERFLRLRLYERNEGRQFLTDYDVAPLSINPLLTRSDADFEVVVETALKKHFDERAVQKFATTAAAS